MNHFNWMMMVFVFAIGLLLVFGLLYYVSQFLEESFQTIAYRYKVPASLAGATLLAVSSSLPEFFTSLNGAIIYGTLEIGFMTIIWSAIFNILVITGVVGISSKEPLKVSKNTIKRDLIFYLSTASVLVLLLLDGALGFADAIVLTLVYVLYVGILYLQRKDHGEGEENEFADASKLKISLSLTLGIVAIGGLSAAMVYMGAEMGQLLGVSVAIISALIFSTGTSLPDLLLSYFAAKRGNGSGAVSNIFGSNTFDITLCFSIPAMVVLSEGNKIEGELSSLTISLILLFLSIFLVAGMIWFRYTVTRVKGWIALMTFFLFMGIFLVTV